MVAERHHRLVVASMASSELANEGDNPEKLHDKLKAVQREREEKLARKLRDFLHQYVRGDKDGFIRQAESEAERLSSAELKKSESNPSYNINIIGDIKQMLKELGTDKGKEIALHGGGGSKARNERAAVAAILEARSRIKDDNRSKNGEKLQHYSEHERGVFVFLCVLVKLEQELWDLVV